ncbi:MAG: sulfate transporter CysZ [Pseudomonadota bacterium]
MTEPNQFNIDNKKLNNPAYSLGCILRGLRMLARPGFRRYLVVPISVNLIMYSIALWLSVSYISGLIERFIPGWLDWLSWLIWPVFLLSFLLVAFFTFTMATNVLMAPFYGRLAERAEKILSGEPLPKPGSGSLTTDIARGVASELKRLAYFALRAVPLLVLFVIPGLNLIAPLLWMLFSAWALALEYTAYPLENRGVLFPEQRQMVKNMRIGFLSFGAVIMLGLTVPILNILIPPAAVIGATAYLSGRKAD